MVGVIVRIVVLLVLAALALLLAALLVPGFHLAWAGFFVAIIIFVVVQSLIEWLVARIFKDSAPTVAGVAGLISTALALWIASLFSEGLSFDGIGAWILATVIVWLVTAVFGWIAARYVTPRLDGTKRK